MTRALPQWAFDNSFVRDLPGCYAEGQPATPPAPKLVRFNAALAQSLGLDVAGLDEDALARLLSGADLPPGAQPVAQAYAGHQFGGFNPQLGDGRALLLGEVIAPGGRFDLHLKGSGRTAFSRGGDGLAALGPMLREYVISEAMHTLGIPSTRSLSVVATGGTVWRENALDGAVLCRVAASHIRIGSFQYLAARGESAMIKRLADYVIDRHYPVVAGAEHPYLALFDAVIDAQIALVVKWMAVGFVHGVMNTDNVTLSGETIDYGPCAFLDVYSEDAVFSSIDHHGRYRFGAQPWIMRWNLARLAETLLPLIDADTERAIAKVTERLDSFSERFQAQWLKAMRAKIGLETAAEGDAALIADLLELMQADGVDFTGLFRALASGDAAELFSDFSRWDRWQTRWRTRLAREGGKEAEQAERMNAVNPVYIPRNRLVEAALASAASGDLAPFDKLVEAVSNPFEARDRLKEFAHPAPAEFGRYTTYCGT